MTTRHHKEIFNVPVYHYNETVTLNLLSPIYAPYFRKAATKTKYNVLLGYLYWLIGKLSALKLDGVERSGNNEYATKTGSAIGCATFVFMCKLKSYRYESVLQKCSIFVFNRPGKLSFGGEGVPKYPLSSSKVPTPYLNSPLKRLCTVSFMPRGPSQCSIFRRK